MCWQFFLKIIIIIGNNTKVNMSFMLSLLILAATISVVVFFCVFLLLFQKMGYICTVLHLVRALHIESVFAVLQENVEVFKNEGWTNDTHSLFAYGRWHTVFQCVLSPYRSSVGISIVYFRSGFSTTFLLISVSKFSHFLFVYIHTTVVKKEYAENPEKSRYLLKLIMLCFILWKKMHYSPFYVF